MCLCSARYVCCGFWKNNPMHSTVVFEAWFDLVAMLRLLRKTKPSGVLSFTCGTGHVGITGMMTRWWRPFQLPVIVQIFTLKLEQASYERGTESLVGPGSHWHFLEQSISHMPSHTSPRVFQLWRGLRFWLYINAWDMPSCFRTHPHNSIVFLSRSIFLMSYSKTVAATLAINSDFGEVRAFSIPAYQRKFVVKGGPWTGGPGALQLCDLTGVSF